MNLFFKRAFITLTIVFSSLFAISVLAATISINANIPSSGGGGGGGGGSTTVYGCTDPAATNYNPAANANDGSCVYAVPGCTNPVATNYNPSATVDDGSCILVVSGCTNQSAINYNPSATVDDGSCVLPIPGCTDPLATNYNSLANTDNGSCVYAVSGCTDPLATNYNSLATIDDGSCSYQISGCTNPLADNYNSQATVDNGSCIISGCTNPLADNYNSQATVDNGSCIVSGCTDPTAINYNLRATVDNGSCSYDPNQIPGCMDSSALNYNSSATIDNGSCTYPLFGCTDSSALNYDPIATTNNGSCVYAIPVIPPLDTFEPTYYYYTNNNGLELLAKKNNIDLLINHDLLIIIPDNFSKEIKKITAVVNGEILTFKYDIDTKQYLLQLGKFTALGINNINFLVVYDDNSAQSNPITVTVKPLGRVFSKLPKDQVRIFGITVSVYDENNNLIIENNKIGSDGRYGFMVKNGKYQLVVFDNGKKIYEGNLFAISNNIINKDIGLTLFEQIVQAVEAVLDNPIIEETNKYTAPAVVSVVSITTFVAVPWWSLVNYLQYLFTEPLAWLFRRKKTSWGVVYNSITKKPVDLAVVRLYDKTSGRLLKSKVTDKEGRYSFLVSEGNYILQVIKPSMIFPSAVLRDVNEDKQFINLYHGETIDITKDQKGIITANVPVDPQNISDSDRAIVKKNFWYKIQKNISIIGPIFAIVSFLIMPTVLIGSFAAIHITLYFLFKRLAGREKATKWGVILDAKTGKPVAGTVAKIYSPEYNKMLEAQVTDRHGRYGFLAGNNVYYISASKNGYADTKTENIDLTHQKSEEVIGRDIELQPVASEESPDIVIEDNNNDQKSAPDLNSFKIDNKNDDHDSDLSPLKEIANKLKQEAIDSTDLNQAAQTNGISKSSVVKESGDSVIKNTPELSNVESIAKEDEFG